MSDRRTSDGMRTVARSLAERKQKERDLVWRYWRHTAGGGSYLDFELTDDDRGLFGDCVELDGEFNGHGKAVLETVMGDPLRFPRPPLSLGERILRHYAGEVPASPNLAAPPNLGELILRHAGVM